MKKYSLLKTIGISFLLVCILSWIISASSLSSGTITSLSKTVPVGLYDLSLLPIITLVSFFMYGLLFLAIGGFYGVLNKTGAYSELVSNVANKVKPKKFVIITIVLLSLLSSLTNLTPILFITVPFLVAILLKQGFNKISAFAATVGSILVGTIGTTYGVINAQIKYYFELSSSYELCTKIILLVMVTFLLIMYVIKKGIPKEENKKTKQKTKNEEIPLYQNINGTRKSLPLIIISVVMLLVSILFMYNWRISFGIKTFDNLYKSIHEFSINGYTLFGNIIGSSQGIGYITIYDLVIIIAVASLILGFTYRIKFSELFEAFINGSKEMIKPAIYATLSCILYAFIYYNGSGNFVNTIVNSLSQNNAAALMSKSAILSLFYNDFTNLIGYNASLFTSYDSTLLPTVGIVLQSVYGFVMLLAPTSVYLIGGLAFLNISYKEWFKYIWKYLLAILLVIIITCVIMFIFI